MNIANTIREQLYALGRNKVWSWGANAWTGGENFLIFKVQGFKLKGKVKISLNGNDLYDIEFIKANKVIKTMNDIYAEDMVDIIDNEVETTNGKYTKKQEKEISQMKGLFS